MQKTIIFIGGTGRSGSTILDRCLGAEPGCVSVGELAYLWETSFLDNQFCGKHRFHDHPFWQAVLMEAKLDTLTAAQARDLYHTRIKLLRLRSFIQHGFHRWQPEDLARISTYKDIMNRLYAAIFSVSGAATIIDSSKIATHAAFLALLPDYRLSCVHLVRDSRAVAFSWSRIKSREPDGGDDKMPLIPASRSAKYWMVHNGMMHLAASKLSLASRIVCYEDFVKDPRSTASSIFSGAGVSASLQHINGSETELPESHNINGNPSKFQHGIVKLEPDDTWRNAMSARARRTVTLLTFPLLLSYGYRL